MATDDPRPGNHQSAAESPFPLAELEVEQVWQRVKDRGSDVAKRIIALDELIARRDDALPDYLLRELERNEMPTAWRDHLIFASEDVEFLDENARTRLRTRLFSLADGMCDSEKALANPEALYSAARRFASLIDPHLVDSEVPRLLRFLRAGEPPLLHQAALQAIQNLFAGAPPERPNAVRSLCRRVVEIAVQFLAADVVSSPSNAALALNAVHALAVLGDRRLDERIEQVQRLRKQWLADQLRRRLEDVRIRWDIRAADFRTQVEILPWARRTPNLQFQSGAHVRLCAAISRLNAIPARPRILQRPWSRAVEAMRRQRIAVAAALAALAIGLVVGNRGLGLPRSTQLELMAARVSLRPSGNMSGANDRAPIEVESGHYRVTGVDYQLDIQSPISGNVTVAQFEWDRKTSVSPALMFPKETQSDIKTDSNGDCSFGPIPAPKRLSVVLVIVCNRTVRDVVEPVLKLRHALEGLEQILFHVENDLVRAGVGRAALTFLLLEPGLRGDDPRTRTTTMLLTPPCGAQPWLCVTAAVGQLATGDKFFGLARRACRGPRSGVTKGGRVPRCDPPDAARPQKFTLQASDG
jgi:hypothetical protein